MRRHGAARFSLLVVAGAGWIAALVTAVWPVWLVDRGLYWKCGTPAIAAHLDYSVACRTAGERHLVSAGGLAALALVVAIVAVVDLDLRAAGRLQAAARWAYGRVAARTDAGWQSAVDASDRMGRSLGPRAAGMIGPFRRARAAWAPVVANGGTVSPRRQAPFGLGVAGASRQVLDLLGSAAAVDRLSWDPASLTWVDAEGGHRVAARLRIPWSLPVRLWVLVVPASPTTSRIELGVRSRFRVHYPMRHHHECHRAALALRANLGPA